MTTWPEYAPESAVYLYTERLDPLLPEPLRFTPDEKSTLKAAARHLFLPDERSKARIMAEKHDERGPTWFLHDSPDSGAHVYVRESAADDHLHYLRLSAVNLANALKLKGAVPLTVRSTGRLLRAAPNPSDGVQYGHLPGTLDVIDEALAEPGEYTSVHVKRGSATGPERLIVTVNYEKDRATYHLRAILPPGELITPPRPKEFTLALRGYRPSPPLLRRGQDAYFPLVKIHDHRTDTVLDQDLNLTYVHVPADALAEAARQAAELKETP